ncbi:hypothetical protein [Neptuniibacter sp. QD37_11]|uniref:hypothetical protein n=1 Tax=Neptuniibacter sp. QD37_11 TaxID=3398209 RepID=UPI0039F5F1BA
MSDFGLQDAQPGDWVYGDQSNICYDTLHKVSDVDCHEVRTLTGGVFNRYTGVKQGSPEIRARLATPKEVQAFLLNGQKSAAQKKLSQCLALIDAIEPEQIESIVQQVDTLTANISKVLHHERRAE